MPTVPITCSGPHTGGVEQLGTLTVPDGVDSAAAAAGYLCADCGAVYTAAIASGQHTPGRPPGPDLVCALLPGLRPAGYTPRHPPGPPSWAPGNRNWPPPAPPSPPGPPTPPAPPALNITPH